MRYDRDGASGSLFIRAMPPGFRLIMSSIISSECHRPSSVIKSCRTLPPVLSRCGGRYLFSRSGAFFFPSLNSVFQNPSRFPAGLASLPPSPSDDIRCTVQRGCCVITLRNTSCTTRSSIGLRLFACMNWGFTKRCLSKIYDLVGKSRSDSARSKPGLGVRISTLPSLSISSRSAFDNSGRHRKRTAWG